MLLSHSSTKSSRFSKLAISVILVLFWKERKLMVLADSSFHSLNLAEQCRYGKRHWDLKYILQEFLAGATN